MITTTPRGYSDGRRYSEPLIKFSVASLQAAIPPNRKLHPNTPISKDCKLAPANLAMPRLNITFYQLEGGVVDQIVRIWSVDRFRFHPLEASPVRAGRC